MVLPTRSGAQILGLALHILLKRFLWSTICTFEREGEIQVLWAIGVALYRPGGRKPMTARKEGAFAAVKISATVLRPRKSSGRPSHYLSGDREGVDDAAYW